MKLLHADGIDSASIRLVIDGATGGFAFLGILFGLWVLSGRPSGPESTVVGAITERVGALSPGS